MHGECLGQSEKQHMLTHCGYFLGNFLNLASGHSASLKWQIAQVISTHNGLVKSEQASKGLLLCRGRWG